MVKFRVEIGLATEDIAPLLVKGMLNSEKEEGIFLRNIIVDIPVTVSSTLRKLVVVSLLITTLEPSPNSIESGSRLDWSFICQPLDL